MTTGRQFFGYTEVKGFRTTEHLLILTLAGGSEVLLSRSGFERGTAETVEDLLLC